MRDKELENLARNMSKFCKNYSTPKPCYVCKYRSQCLQLKYTPAQLEFDKIKLLNELKEIEK